MLRYLIIMAGMLLQTIACGQQLNFRGLPVDTISIYSSSGHYHFDDKGTTTGRTNEYIIAFEKNTNKYFNLEYNIISTKSTHRPKTLERNKKSVIKARSGLVPNNKIEQILLAFSSNYVAPTFENMGFKKSSFFSLTSEKHVRAVAKQYKQGWNFKMKYTTREENKMLFSGCQNTDTFDLFLSTSFDTDGYAMVTDVWDEIHVYIKTPSKLFSYEGKYPNIFKQPWYDHTDNSKGLPNSIVNFNINRSLVSILPHKFYRKNSIELKALTYRYVEWYLKRRNIIY